MARTTKSQWEFGDLLTPSVPTPLPLAPPIRKILSVGDFTLQIKRSLERDFATVWVTGEVSNLRAQPSGHLYFVLKDNQAQLSCVLFRGQTVAEKSQLRDGVQVILGGDLTVYESRGQYQLRVIHVELQGAGALQAAFERLKARLSGEGLFDPGRKRLIPRYPKRVGIVTSASTAALRDVIHVLSRRAGGMEVILSPCRVQGKGAESEIAMAIDRLNAWSSPASPIDVILVTRGGGSIEDLWCFNEEVVARAIVRSRIPVVSAVGHEIDFTIADFAADLRAATPSAAAELLTEGYMAASESVGRARRRLSLWTSGQVRQRSERLEMAARRLARAHPQRVAEEKSQLLDDLRLRLSESWRSGSQAHHQELADWVRRLAAVRPQAYLERSASHERDLRRRLVSTVEKSIHFHQSHFRRLADTLRTLSPKSVLDRGYSITQNADTGEVVRKADQVQPGCRIRTLLAVGNIESVIELQSRDET